MTTPHCERCPLPAAVRCPGSSNAGICRRVTEPGQEAFVASLARRFPPLATQAANLAAAVGRFVASGGELASEEERARRLAICATCDRFADGRCRECGCQLAYKSMMMSEHCPLPSPKW